MTKISEEDIKHLAKLANLKISSKELKIYKEQLSEVINYLNQLSEVNTSNVEPTSQTTGLTNSLRLDKIDAAESLTPKKALSGTEKTHNDYFVVPAVIEKE